MRGRSLSEVARSLGILLFLALLPAAAVAQEPESDEFQLTTPVRLDLKRLQDSWQNWTRAYFQDDEEQGRAALSQLLSVMENLSMEKVPGLAAAGAAFAVRSAQEGNVERGRWAVDCARELDSGRPEGDFASSAVEWAAGNYPAAVVARFQGYAKLFSLSLEGQVWRQNLGIAAIYLMMLAGVLFLVLLMAIRGADLFHDLGRLVSPPLSRTPADGAALLLLIWPAVLPSGLLWLAVYWSVLLWGYATLSQRGILAAFLVGLGLAPVAVGYHQKAVQDEGLPPIRAFENLEARRLYGALLLDIEALRNLKGDSPVVTELIADLHRDFGQWEYARVVYDKMIADNPGVEEVAPALNNVGIYHYLRRDYGTAVTYFTDATQADPRYAEAWYNLSRAYYANLAFNEAHAPLAEAKKLDPDRVRIWESQKEAGQDVVIPINGGLARSGEIRRALGAADGESTPAPLLTPAYPSLAAALAALFAAVGLDLVRKKKGYPSSKFTGRPAYVDNRWLSALAPGWASTRDGNGVQAFLAVLFVVATLLIPILGTSSTYRAYLGYDAGPSVLSVLGLVVLLIFLGLRLLQALRAANG